MNQKRTSKTYIKNSCSTLSRWPTSAKLNKKMFYTLEFGPSIFAVCQKGKFSIKSTFYLPFFQMSLFKYSFSIE